MIIAERKLTVAVPLTQMNTDERRWDTDKEIGELKAARPLPVA